LRVKKEERKKPAHKKEKLEANIDFNSGFDHGFSGLAEYASDEETQSKPKPQEKPKVTNEH